MTMRHRARGLLLGIIVALPVVCGAAQAAPTRPIKENLSAHWGLDVDATTGADICTVASGDECQAGTQTSQGSGFDYPKAAAIDNDPASQKYEDVYVIDNSHRVLVYSANGQFLFTFGGSVNETTGQDVCTAAEMAAGDECGEGTTGPEPGAIGEGASIAIDPASGNVYIAALVKEPEYPGYGDRVQEFTAEGQFVAEFGQNVNQTTGGNICTAMEVCGGPTEHPYEEANAPVTEHDAFSFTDGTVLSVGGPEDLVYVGEHGRVQELQRDGAYSGEIPLEFITTLPDSEANHIAVDPTGDVYLTYYMLYEIVNGKQEVGNHSLGTVYEFSRTGALASEFTLTPREEPARFEVEALQVDASGRLAVVEQEERIVFVPPFGYERHAYGSLYNVVGGRLHLVSEFSVESPTRPGENELEGIAFNPSDAMYAGGGGDQEVLVYSPVFVGEVMTGNLACSEETEIETDVTLVCTMHGEVNPLGVGDTESWFQWGITAKMPETTPVQSIRTGESPVPQEADAADLTPNATLHYRMAGRDEPVQAPEQLVGETLAPKLPTVAPRVIGAPAAEAVTAFTASLLGAVNPENAETEYFFEYLAGGETIKEACPSGVERESCPGVLRTAGRRSPVYANIGAAIEARELAPTTTYHYRLMAINASGQGATYVGGNGEGASEEGTFTTPPVPAPMAVTGGASAVQAKSATVEGSVNPNGQASTYRFELGVDKAVATQYGVVGSDSAGSGSEPVPESAVLSGLQPGTTYAYRVSVANAFGTSYGATMTFRTGGLPEALSVPSTLAQLRTPQCPPDCFEPDVEGGKGNGGAGRRRKHHRKAHHKARHKLKGAHRHKHQKGRGRQ